MSWQFRRMAAMQGGSMTKFAAHRHRLLKMVAGGGVGARKDQGVRTTAYDEAMKAPLPQAVAAELDRRLSEGSLPRRTAH